MKCRIADFNIVFNNKYPFMEKRCAKFVGEFETADFEVSTTEEDILKEYNADESKRNLGYQESLCLFKELAHIIPQKNAFWMHGALLETNNRGILLCAQSGTGKTTHMLLWQKLLGDKMTIVNGDKPIVRFFEGEPNIPYAYGAPWCGKENYGINSRTVLTDVCFLKRNTINSVKNVNKKDCINEIMQHVHVPNNSQSLLNTMTLINKVINTCNLWEINCNMDISAAEVAYNTIFGSK